MKLRNRIISTAALMLLSVLPVRWAAGQSLASKDRAAGTTVPARGISGVVIEKVVKNSDGERAGLKEEDILLRWSRGESKGEIESPFDVSLIQIEQASRGAVTLEGESGSEKTVWILGAGDWGLRTRPNLPLHLLTLYREGQTLAEAGKLTQAAERWQSAAGQLNRTQPTWLHPWLLSHTAEMFTKARQWKESDDAYQEAMQQAAATGPEVKAQLLRAWAMAFQQRSDWTNAERCYQQTMAEIEKSGAETMFLAETLNRMGFSLRKHRDLAKAEDYYGRALAIEHKLAPGSLAVAKSLNGLGNIADDRGDLDKAQEQDHQALSIEERLAPENLDAADSLSDL